MISSLRRSLTAVGLLLALAACGSPAEEQGGGEDAGGAAGDVLRTAYQQDMDTFDPDNGFEVAGLGAIAAVYEGLVEYAPGSTDVVGLLAEDWEVSDDALTYTFTIREGVTFHDGAELTAEEVLASFQRRADGELVLSYFLGNVEEMEAPDPTTFVVRLGTPQPSFLDSLASPWGPKVIGPGALVDQAGDDDAASFLDEEAIGTGPFRLASFTRGQEYVLERFDDYWGDAPHFASVEIAIVPDIGQQVLRLQQGDLDLVLHGYPFEQLEGVPEEIEVTTYRDLGLEMAYVNTAGVLSDPDLREAVRTAAAPEEWVAGAFSGHAEPALSLYPRAMITPDEPYAYPDDLEAARQAVEEAGGLELEIVYTQQEEGVQRRVADLLIARLAEAGIQATARAVPQDEVFTYVEDPAGGPDLLIAQNNPDSAHPETQAGLFYAKDAPLNIFGYSNPEADELFAAGSELESGPERDARYLEGARLVFEDGAFLPLADVDDVVVHRSGLTDLDVRPAMPWNIDFGSVRG